MLVYQRVVFVDIHMTRGLPNNLEGNGPRLGLRPNFARQAATRNDRNGGNHPPTIDCFGMMFICSG